MTEMTEEFGGIRNTLSQLQTRGEKTASEADIRLLHVNLNVMRQDIADLKQRQSPANPSADTASTNTDNRPADNPPTGDGCKSIYVLSDSTTKLLDSKRLSVDKYKVTTRTNPNARIKDIEAKVDLLDKQDKHLTTCDSIIIHIGVNNVSDAETSEQSAPSTHS